MNINKSGLDLIKSFEGLRLKAYRCPAKVLTIGYGHTGNVLEGETITALTAEALLKQDLERFEKCVDDAVKVELTENQFSALVSLAYNIGCGAFKGSTLVKKLNKEDYQGAAMQFSVWIKVKSTTSNGLIRRRRAEQLLFLKA